MAISCLPCRRQGLIQERARMIDLGQYQTAEDRRASMEADKEAVFQAHRKRMAQLIAELELEKPIQEKVF